MSEQIKWPISHMVKIRMRWHELKALFSPAIHNLKIDFKIMPDYMQHKQQGIYVKVGTLLGVKFVMIFAKESKKWGKSSGRYILHALEKFFCLFCFYW